MADKTLLDYIDENDVHLTITPNRRSILPGLNRSRLSSSRKSVKLRKLYTPEDYSNNDDKPAKKRRLSSLSHNATIGNASNIDSSLEFVEVTPGIDALKSLTFRSYLDNQTLKAGVNVNSSPTQVSRPLCDANRDTFLSPASLKLATRKEIQKGGSEYKSTDEENKGVAVNGIKNLWKSPVPTCSKNRTPNSASSSYFSSVTERTPRISKGDVSNGQVLRKIFQTPVRLNSHNPEKVESNTPGLGNLFNERTPQSGRHGVLVTPDTSDSAREQSLGSRNESSLEPLRTPDSSNFHKRQEIRKRLCGTPEVTPNRPHNLSARSPFIPPGQIQIEGIRELELKTPDKSRAEIAKERNGLKQIGLTTPKSGQLGLKRLVQNETPSGSGNSTALRTSKDLARNEDDLPPTQPISSILLKDIIAYVEVRVGADNRSWGIKAHLRSLGATVRDKFTNDVTHVIFNEGLMSTYKKAIKKNVHLVSVLWIEECKNAQTIVSERLFPPFDMERYEFPDLLKKFRRARSVQPDFEAIEQGIEKRRRKKTVPLELNKPEVEQPELPFYRRKIKVPGFLENVSKENSYVRTLLGIEDIGPEYEDFVNRSTSPTLSEEEELENPPTLAVRLLRKVLTPKSSPNTNLNDERQTPVSGSASDNMEETPKRITRFSELRKSTPVPVRSEKIDENSGNLLEDTSASGKQTVVDFNTEKPSTSSKPDTKKENSKNINKKVTAIDYSTEKASTSSKPDTKKENSKNISKKVTAVDFNTEEASTSSKPDTGKENSENVNNEIEERKAKKRKYSALDEIAVKIATEKCRSPFEPSTVGNASIRKNTSNITNRKPPDLKKTNSENQSKGMTSKKRKLMTLRRTETPEELSVSMTEEEPIVSSQCPYTPEEEELKRKKKSVAPSESSAMDITPCVATTSNAQPTTERKIKQARKKFKTPSGNKHEVVGKVGCARNSLAEFITTDQAARTEAQEKPKEVKKILPSLVCTGLQRHEVEVIASVVQGLGGFVLEAKVSSNTTHVVTSGPKRTLNLLKGIARGCWIVMQEWVLRSLVAGKWIEEDAYELQDFSPAVKQSRLQRLAFGRFYKQDLFSTCGAIYVSGKSVPPRQELEELIRLCGGRVVSARRSAQLMVGKSSSSRYDKLKQVSENWVLDSVTFCTLKPLHEYET